MTTLAEKYRPARLEDIAGHEAYNLRACMMALETL